VTSAVGRVLCATVFIGCWPVEAGAQTAPLPAVARGEAVNLRYVTAYIRDHWQRRYGLVTVG